MKNADELLLRKCGREQYQKLTNLMNPWVNSFVEEYVRLCEPTSVFVRTDSAEDNEYIRTQALELKEENALSIEGHTYHFDSIFDQARDKKATKYLLEKDQSLGEQINSIERNAGLAEIKNILKGIMRGKEMIVAFFGLGPLDSPFFIPCLQITDSFYVAHSEGILYRSGYEACVRLRGKGNYFRFVHSAGVLENSVSKDIANRRVYIDLNENTVFSTNTQYAGNTVGLKKLSLRLAIRKASQEGWLAEHMFVMGINGPRGRKTYFCGAYPSGCGKTSTAMLPGETIVGDDIAYLRKIEGKVCAVNVECGIFGIIRDVNSQGDPLIWQALTTPGEAIFSNILVSEGVPYWLGDGRATPARGVNCSGEWYKGKLDTQGNEIPFAHKNARYTISISRLGNCDEKLNDPGGVDVGAIVYGGRDSDTTVPVLQSFNWQHGVVTMGASLESETTAATLGEEGIRAFNPMSNLDFLSIPMGTYISNHLVFSKNIKNVPLIFGVNYFLRNKKGIYFNAMEDKKIWFKWMERRIYNEIDAVPTPVGYMPLYHDLEALFKEFLQKEYTEDDYTHQFTLRIPENIEKIQRIVNIYKKNVADCPQELYDILQEQESRLTALQKRHGDYVNPFILVKA